MCGNINILKNTCSLVESLVPTCFFYHVSVPLPTSPKVLHTKRETLRGQCLSMSIVVHKKEYHTFSHSDLLKSLRRRLFFQP